MSCACPRSICRTTKAPPLVRNVNGPAVLVSWNSSTANDVKEYVLSRSEGAQATPLTIGRFSNTMSYQDTSVSLGKQYTYRLTAVDSAGNVSPVVADSLVVREFTPPPAPRYARVKPNTAGGVEVHWERVIETGLVGYHVYRLPTPTAVGERITKTPVTELVFVDRTGSATAYYVIRAVDQSGNESRPSPAARAER